jgi:hypothetical protein
MNNGFADANITALAFDPEAYAIYAGTANFGVWVYPASDASSRYP